MNVKYLRGVLIMNKRALGEKMFKSFFDGDLKPLLEEVKKDDTLDLEFRGESHAILYYRGGKICDIYEDKVVFDIAYIPEALKAETVNELNVGNFVNIINEIPLYKRYIDYKMSEKHAYEREFQQVVVRENNRHHDISHDSDYYITDIEYMDDDGTRTSRFDMISIKWRSTGIDRREHNASKVPVLSIIEMKYGDNALTGNSGIGDHLRDMRDFIKSNEMSFFCDDVAEIFKQKCKLGLIPDMKDKPHEVSNLSDRRIEVVFLIGNHKPAKSKLCEEIAKIKSSEYDFDIKFARASLMGYCLYDSLMLTPEECVEFLQKNK